MTIQSGAGLTKFNEGFSPVAKPDAKGKWEYGYGFDIPAPAPGQPIPTITRAEADIRFPGFYMVACGRAEVDVGPEYAAMCPQRQAVLNDMAYEIGGAGLAQFKTMLGHIRSGEWDQAGQALRDSLLFQQVPHRETRNIAIITTGQWPS